jgi:hypothetical protein
MVSAVSAAYSFRTNFRTAPTIADGGGFLEAAAGLQSASDLLQCMNLLLALFCHP